MGTQAALIAETVADMKRAIAKHEDSSDSDEPYLRPSNRGNKLKRKAHHLRDGRSGQTAVLKAYKRSVEYNGYHREILRKNPKRYDEDGDELDDEDEDGEADARAAEENPYAEIRLENLLMPLVSASSLPEHPSMKHIYTSSVLPDMVQHACEMVQRERRNLSNLRLLLTKFRGDETWIPCERLYSENDEVMFDTERVYSSRLQDKEQDEANGLDGQGMINYALNESTQRRPSKSPKGGIQKNSSSRDSVGSNELTAQKPSTNTDQVTMNGHLPDIALTEREVEDMHNAKMTDREDVETSKPDQQINAETADEPEDPKRAERRRYEDKIVEIVGPDVSISKIAEPEDPSNETGQPGENDSIVQETKNVASRSASGKSVTPMKQDENEEDGEEMAGADDDSKPPARRIRTRAQAHAASDAEASSRPESPDSWVIPEIAPLFVIPEGAVPDKDVGLPPHEAEETRRILIMYVQKQEEVCRGAEKLYNGLLQADWQRQTVLEWCKAEGHVGELSDGEDWYDKEVWGLEDDLRKGHNDEEEDNAIQGKKTRGRRA